jgi:hypothetical protein
VLVPMLQQSLAAAAQTGLLLVVQHELSEALERLKAVGRVAAADGAHSSGSGSARLLVQEQEHAPARKRSKRCRPSDLAGFLRSAGKWGSGGAVKSGTSGSPGSFQDMSWMENLKKSACVSEETVDSWFPAARDDDSLEGTRQGNNRHRGVVGVGGAGGAGAGLGGWALVKERCDMLRASAAEWASVVQTNEDAGVAWGGDARDEEAEAFEQAERDLNAAVRAAVAAGGKEMSACSFPLRAWFAALSGLSVTELESVALLRRCFRRNDCIQDSAASSDGAGQGEAIGLPPAVSLRARRLSDGHTAFFRAVLALLQGHDVRNAHWAVESARFALLDGHAPAAIRCLAVTAMHVLGTDKGSVASGGALARERGRERGDGWGSGGSSKVLSLPPALADLLVTCLCKVHRHVDALLVVQMMMPAQVPKEPCKRALLHTKETC